MKSLFGTKDSLEKHLEEIHKSVLAYYPEAQMADVDKAFHFATKHHEGQKRISGDPYYIHPIEVAKTLAKLKLDLASITASLLHDVVEDTEVNLEDIKRDLAKR